MIHLGRSTTVVLYAVLSVQQAALRLAIPVPMEAEADFREAAIALEANPWQKTSKEVASNWVVDFSRPAARDEAAGLGSLIAEMEGLNV